MSTYLYLSRHTDTIERVPESFLISQKYYSKNVDEIAGYILTDYGIFKKVSESSSCAMPDISGIIPNDDEDLSSLDSDLKNMRQVLSFIEP